MTTPGKVVVALSSSALAMECHKDGYQPERREYPGRRAPGAGIPAVMRPEEK